VVLVDPRRVEHDGNALILPQQAGAPAAGLVGGVVGRFVSVDPRDGSPRLDGEFAGEVVEATDLDAYARGGGNDGSLRRLGDPRVRVLERVFMLPRMTKATRTAAARRSRLTGSTGEPQRGVTPA
jgi:hypothetical protein